MAHTLNKAPTGEVDAFTKPIINLRAMRPVVLVFKFTKLNF